MRCVCDSSVRRAPGAGELEPAPARHAFVPVAIPYSPVRYDPPGLEGVWSPRHTGDAHAGRRAASAGELEPTPARHAFVPVAVLHRAVRRRPPDLEGV